jgi:hypothetical protein
MILFEKNESKPAGYQGRFLLCSCNQKKKGSFLMAAAAEPNTSASYKLIYVDFSLFSARFGVFSFEKA